MSDNIERFTQGRPAIGQGQGIGLSDGTTWSHSDSTSHVADLLKSRGESISIAAEHGVSQSRTVSADGVSLAVTPAQCFGVSRSHKVSDRRLTKLFQRILGRLRAR